MFLKIVVSSFVVFVLSACTGTFYTTTNMIPKTKGDDLEGVVYYPPVLMKQISATTIALDKDGKVVADELGSAAVSGVKCIPVRTEKIVTMPDYANPKRIYYRSGVFESNTFGVTLDSSGLLTGVNSQSTPDQGKAFSNLGSTIGALATAGVIRVTVVPPKEGGEKPKLACTDGSTIVSFTPYQAK